jgi:hypothetical protein
MATEWVEIEHPDVEKTARVPRSAVPVHARSGWREVVNLPERDVPDPAPDSYNPEPIPDDGDQSQGEEDR